MAVLATVTTVLLRGTQLCVFRGEAKTGVTMRFVAERPIRAPVPGETWSIEGESVVHPVYGRQVRVDRMSLQRPRGHLVRRLLAGERFPGVGDATARRLWNAFGDRLTAVLDAGGRAELERILGNGDRATAQIDTILTEWPLVVGEPELLAWCERHDVPGRAAGRIAACYGQDALKLLEKDPYRLLAFLNWRTTDMIATGMGVAAGDRRRLAAAVEAALYDRLGTGDTLVTTSALRTAVEALLGPSTGDAAIEAARRLGAAVKRPSGWQAAGPALMEEALAERIAQDLVSFSPSPGVLPLPAAPRGSPTLNAGQADAVRMALSSPFSLLVGGAGTGKTTALRAINEAAAEIGLPVEMMALSGRAALRIREATGAQARTIAGFLMLAQQDRLDLQAPPLIVVDEASMADLGSLYGIIRAVPEGSRFLLVGDDGQLPPVGFGLTLHALLDVPEIPRVVLTEVMRQAAETGIPAAAQAVREGRLPDLSGYREDDEIGVSIAGCAEDEVVATAVNIRRRLPSAQIVGSVKRAPHGTTAMNAALHDAWISSKGLASRDFVTGEPVIWTVNDYDLELWNGSLGRVRGATDDGLLIRFDDEDEREIPGPLLNNVEHAWAVTTHKAQGSAFDTVIVPVTRSRILDRTLLYTALTRARRRVILVGDVAVIRDAIERPPHALRRGTWLREAFRAEIARLREKAAA